MPRICLLLLVLLQACSPPLRVRPEKLVTADETQPLRAAIIDEDTAVDTLDFNPYLLGLLPVIVEVNSGKSFSSKSIYFVTSDGRRITPLRAEKVYDKVLDSYDVTLYPLVLSKEEKAKFLSLCLDLSKPITPPAKGIVFFPLQVQSGTLEIQGRTVAITP
ncbi:MAG: hypothetical protein RMM17_06610 [Acidobacteriota bacterium]|nr:hypothetical protein [Blastocatellia bacterium]MDW8412335.1 hypothetical protein [Acidobacteriota bacterium]